MKLPLRILFNVIALSILPFAAIAAEGPAYEQCLEKVEDKFGRAIQGCEALENPSNEAVEACYERAEKARDLGKSQCSQR